jgi:hypothetical protein
MGFTPFEPSIGKQFFAHIAQWFADAASAHWRVQKGYAPKSSVGVDGISGTAFAI